MTIICRLQSRQFKSPSFSPFTQHDVAQLHLKTGHQRLKPAPNCLSVLLEPPGILNLLLPPPRMHNSHTPLLQLFESPNPFLTPQGTHNPQTPLPEKRTPHVLLQNLGRHSLCTSPLEHPGKCNRQGRSLHRGGRLPKEVKMVAARTRSFGERRGQRRLRRAR